MPDFPITVTDSHGNELDITPEAGVVYIDTVRGDPPLFAFGSDDRREAFAQAWIAACHAADEQVRPAACGAVSPYAGPPCAVQGAHEDHVSRGPGGVILAMWPVSDG